MPYTNTRKMLLGYPFNLEWATEYATEYGFTQDFVFNAAVCISHHASSTIGEAPHLFTIIHNHKVYPFFAFASTDPYDDLFPCGTQEESIAKLKEIMGAKGPPTWYQKYS